jgi:spermidine synthase
MSRYLPLYLIVAISGASVLAIEILGTRILGPFYGVSLFLWSALITVTLAALSTGYAVGGRWADRGPRYSRLGLVLAGAGVWLLLVPVVRTPALRLVEPLGLRAAVLITSAVLFFVPLALLGTVSPYAIRLKALSLDEVGRTAGDLYAVSTVASVVAALVTGFLLIPNVGVHRLVLILGALLIAGAAVAFSRGRALAPGLACAAAALIAGGAALAGLGAEKPDPKDGLLDVEQSPYAEIRVIQWEDSRLLLIDGGGHTIVEPGTWRSHYRYVGVVDLLKKLFPGPGRMLLLGLGGGSIAKSYAGSGWSVDAVEIDPVVVDVAHRYFGLEPSDCRISTMDARRYLTSRSDTYDLIVLDAFGSSSIPFHLVSEESFDLIASRLAPDGVLAINIESVGWKDVLVRSLAATLGQSFREVVALPTAEPPNVLGNLIVLASNRELEIPDEKLERPRDFLGDSYRHWLVVQQNHAWDNRFTPDTAGVPVLTDDRNPVDTWSERINLAGREVLHRDFEWSHLAW